MDDRCYMPCLETVEASAKAYAVAAILAAVIAAAFCGGLCGLLVHDWWPGPRDNAPKLIPLMAIGALGFGFFFVRIALRCGYRWKTDREGLTEYRLAGRRYVAWTEVTRASQSKSWIGEERYSVWVGKKQFTIPKISIDSPVLAASIWQHLRRLGKADESFVADEAGSLWTPIPASIPEDFDYYSPKVPDWRLTVVWLVAVIAGCCAAWMWQPKLATEHAGNFLSHFVFVLIPHLFKMVRERMVTARSVFIRSQWFEATNAFGKIDIQWSDLRTVRSTNGGLILSAGGLRKTVLLPYKHGNQEQARVILAAIRRLRGPGCSVAVPIPRLILASQMIKELSTDLDTGPLPDSVEVRPPRLSYALLAVSAIIVLAVAAAVWRLTGLGRESWPLLALLGVMLLLAMAAMGSYLVYYRADAHGILRRSMFRRQLVAWSDVTEYVVKPMQVNEIIIHLANEQVQFERTLKGANGKVLMKIVFTTGKLEERAAFGAFVDRKLAAVRRDEA